MTTLAQFRKLSQGKQADIIRLKADFLWHRPDAFCIKFLYSYNNFFIEVSFVQQHGAIGIAAFTYDYERIEKYISVDDLIAVL